MIVSNEELYNDHLELLARCLHQHQQRFPKSANQLQKAQSVLTKARTRSSFLSPDQQLIKTAKKVLNALDIKKPTTSALTCVEEEQKQAAIEYALSPITEYFINHQQSLENAFNTINDPSTHHQKTPRLTPRFLSPEHKELGDDLIFTQIDAQGNLFETTADQNKFNMIYEQDGKLVENEKLQLSAGDIVFLSGDFFGIPKSPISETKNPKKALDTDIANRFKSAYESLSRSGNDQLIYKVKKILNTTYSHNSTLNEYTQRGWIFGIK